MDKEFLLFKRHLMFNHFLNTIFDKEGEEIIATYITYP